MLLIILFVVVFDVFIWVILVFYVVVIGVFVLLMYLILLVVMEFDIIGIICVGKYVLNYLFMLSGLGGIIVGVVLGFVIVLMII